MTDIQGRCPACRGTSLFLGSGGHVTCSRLDCPNPCAADQLLHGEQPAPAPAATDATSHVYLSTGCLHGHHDYCQNHTGRDGTKTPAQCKFCAAPCICGCHTPKETTMPTCTATIEGPHVLGGGPITCTREAGHPGNHTGPQTSDGKTLWTDGNAGTTPHREQQ
ncbi:hypothetical protein [Streptomyces sp. ECR3.8]|uniref:hypothetical protein n=1 Tax=Streptomyces sp. ECR3.8 TaxID=3461009 RepID=UPI004042AFDB